MVTDPLPKPVSWLLAKRARWLDHLLLNQASAVLHAQTVAVTF